MARIIDAWMQHPTPRHLGDPMFDSLKRWTAKTPIPDAVTPEMTIAAMDQGKVALSLASAWCAPHGWMITNDEVAAVAAAYPGRIVGVASADLGRPMDAVREIRRAVTTLGFKAVRVLPWLWSVPPTDRRFYPIFAACVELGVPFCTQVGHTGPLRPSEPGRPIPYIDEIAIDFPELAIVCGHIGYPWTEDMIAVATKHENVFIDTSAYTVKRYPPELVRYLKTNGRKKVLFGTNYPMITPAKALEGLEDLGLDAETRELFLGGNAARVFKV